MKIATYNINGINGRLEILLRWLKEAQPDIVCLQELKAEDNKFPEKAVNDAGYQGIWHGQKSWNGVAILSKTEIKELRNDLPGEDEEFTHSRYIEAFINGIVIGCIYLPNGNPWPGPKFAYKLRWFNRLAEDYGINPSRFLEEVDRLDTCGFYEEVREDGGLTLRMTEPDWNFLNTLETDV